MMVTIIIITLTMAMMMMVIIIIIMKIVRVRWLMITMERWMRRLMINQFFFAHSEVRGPTNKLEACRSVMIFGGCRSVDQEERHQVLVEHHED